MKRICRAVLIVMMLLLMLVGMTGCGKTKLNLTEGVGVTFSGADGNGRASICFNAEDPSDNTPAFLYKLMNSGKLAANDWQTLLTLGKAISYELSQEDELSNGDKVTLTISVNDAILESMNMKAKSEKLTFTVKGLAKVKTVRPFQNFEIVFGGISPDAYIDHYTQSEEIDGVTISYSIEEPSPYRDGQVLTVSARLSDTEYYSLEEDTMTVTVSGVDKYISDISELQPGTLDALRTKADAVMAEKIEDWEGYYSYKDFEFVGYELWTRRENYIGKGNVVYLYYRINAIDDGTDFSTYYYIGFENVLQRQDGTQEVDVERYSYPSFILYSQLKEYTTLESRTSEIETRYGSAYNVQKHCLG